MIENRIFTDEEEMELSNFLSEHHTLFQTFFRIGRPVFTKKIPTAAVGFDSDGHFFIMYLNPDFWDSLDVFNKAFVISHECLHIILNHGKRGMGIGLKHELINIAQDIVINEMLVSGFGFNRYDVFNWDKFCFVDTIFTNDEILENNIRKHKTFKYYLKLMSQLGKAPEAETVDMHGFNGDGKGLPSDMQGKIDELSDNIQNAMDSIVDELEEDISDEEKHELAESLGDELLADLSSSYGDGSGESSASESAGGNPIGRFKDILKKKVKPNKKWETIISNHLRSLLKKEEQLKESWLAKGRRHYLLPDDLMLQGDWLQESKAKERHSIVFFLDSSGSCHNLSQRFYDLLRTIPQKKFKIDAYSFDTQVYSLDIEEARIKGFGGTKFSILANKVEELTAENKKHPDAIFVVTDGFSVDDCLVKKPKVWHWILTPTHSKKNIDIKSNFHDLSNFR